MKHLFQIKNLKTSFAQKLASQQCAESQELTMLRSSANGAINHISPTNTKRHFIAEQIAELKQDKLETVEVNSIQIESIQDVYCLTIPSYGCFKLSENSPVVSNCDAGGYYIAYTFPITKPVLTPIFTMPY